jgi:raffinose/stachyose/melibiose transport system permease protein
MIEMYWLSRRSIKLIMILPALILFSVYVIIPIFLTAYYSLTDYSGIGRPGFIGLRNYYFLFQDKMFLSSLKNTLVILVMIMLLIIPCSFILALLLDKSFKGNGIVKAMNFLPFVIAPILVGLIWYFILDPSIGLINNFLSLIGLDSLNQQWIGGKTLTPYSIAVVYLWQVLGYYATIFLAGLKAIPVDIYEATDIEGANVIQKIFYVTIPMLRETTIIIVILIITGGFKIFETVQQLTGGGPNHISDVLVTYMYHVTFTTSRYGYGMSIATISAVFSLVCTCSYLMIARKSMKRGAAL